VKSSGTWNDKNHAAWKAFDQEIGKEDTCYHTARDAYKEGKHVLETNLDGKHKGEWLSLQLPSPFVLAGIKIYDRNGDMDRRQAWNKCWVLASSDGENWTELCQTDYNQFMTDGGQQVNKNALTGTDLKCGSSIITVDATAAYTHFAVVFEEAFRHFKHHDGGMIAFQQMYLYGVPAEAKNDQVAPASVE